MKEPPVNIRYGAMLSPTSHSITGTAVLAYHQLAFLADGLRSPRITSCDGNIPIHKIRDYILTMDARTSFKRTEAPHRLSG